jgi:hypothetical protein
MQFLEEMMNEKTKAVLLDRVYRLDRDITWNANNLVSQRSQVEATESVLVAQEAERAALIEDLEQAGVEVNVPVQS